MSTGKFTFFILIFVFIKFSTSQSIEQTDWYGTWEGSYKVTVGDMPGTAKEILTINSLHKDKYFHMATYRWMVEDSSNNWSEDHFLSIDKSSFKISGFCIDDNGSDYLQVVKGLIIDDNKINLKGDCQFFTVNVTLELKKDGKIYKSSKLIYKEGGKEITQETVYTKIK